MDTLNDERRVGDVQLGALWGKSNAGGRVNLLLQHLLDAAAVAELIWDCYLAPSVRTAVDRCCDGQGRALFALLCALHDVGKATPAFQAKAPELAQRVRAAGLGWQGLSRDQLRWHHSRAGAVIVKRVLETAGWDRRAVQWVWPLVAGHHGHVPGGGVLAGRLSRGEAQGRGAGWSRAQEALVHRVAGALGLELAAICPSGRPRRAEQLTLSGAIIMADWIASDEQHFQGVERLEHVSVEAARARAELAWKALALRGGWNPAGLALPADIVADRFGVPARPPQVAAVELAWRLPGPGLIILEAPMGEGKTEAALAAAEVLAARFGADGVFVGMPTQATSDPMFTRVRAWAQAVEPGVPVAVLHGKRRFNREWQELRRQVRVVGVDEFGCDDAYGCVATASASTASDAPAEWFLGGKRGLLVPVTVGTVDQLLHAATRTRHVMLRHLGLAGRVVVLDEVHAYDVYMSQFLFEALRWLADAGVSVILLSATLAAGQRAELVRAYLQGAEARRDVDAAAAPVARAYPRCLSAGLVGGHARFESRTPASWRTSSTFSVELLDEDQALGREDPYESVAILIRDALREGGCALIVRNTVSRAQRTFARLRMDLGEDVVLIHARLIAGERADRTARVLDLLGRPGRDGAPPRPHRLVVVATQLAEQSFDVDVDLLVTDLAPIDLLLQRAGRVHRHARPADARPPRVRSPRIAVAGMTRRQGRPPLFPIGSRYVYGEHLLLRTAAEVFDAADGDGWNLPTDIPHLVDRVYGDERIGPQEWAESCARAAEAWTRGCEDRRHKAEPFLLAGEDDLGKETLQGLHDRSTADLDNDDAVAAVVRDGPESVEVVLVRRDVAGYRTLGGRPMGPTGEAVSSADIAEEVVRSSLRLPAREQVTAAAKAELRPLPGWGADPWLRRARALVLDDTNAGANTARLGGRLLTYNHTLGLLDERLP